MRPDRRECSDHAARAERARAFDLRRGLVACAFAGTTWACQLVNDVSSYTFRASSADAGGAGKSPAEPEDGGVPTSPVSTSPGQEVNAPFDDAGSELVGDALDDAGAATPERAPPEPSTPEPPEPEPLPEPPPPDPQYGCSFVEFCNADRVDGSGDQERCQHAGCTLDDAIRECRVEVGTICGNVQPPYVLVTLSDERVILN